jgi:hypothetical protein
VRRRLRLCEILAGGVLTTSVVFAQGAAPTTDDCQACHAEPSMTRANGQPVVVPPQAFAPSVHSVLSCIDCHADLAKVTAFPHSEKLAPVYCARCHVAPAA